MNGHNDADDIDNKTRRAVFPSRFRPFLSGDRQVLRTMKTMSPKPIIARVFRRWSVPPGLTFALVQDVEQQLWIVESCPVGTQFWTVAQAAPPMLPVVFPSSDQDLGSNQTTGGRGKPLELMHQEEIPLGLMHQEEILTT